MAVFLMRDNSDPQWLYDDEPTARDDAYSELITANIHLEQIAAHLDQIKLAAAAAAVCLIAIAYKVWFG